MDLQSASIIKFFSCVICSSTHYPHLHASMLLCKAFEFVFLQVEWRSSVSGEKLIVLINDVEFPVFAGLNNIAD